MIDITVEKKQRLSENQHVIPNGIIGMVFLIATEIMFFSGLISGYIVNRSERPGAWEAPWQHILPFEQTQLNTMILLLSALFMASATRAIYKNKNPHKTKIYLLITFAMGFAFVILQGKEWISLIEYGLTTGSSIFGAFFYIIVGAHGLHVMAGLVILLYLLRRISIASVNQKNMAFSIVVGSMYWYFVVFLWPVLYYLVYLS